MIAEPVVLEDVKLIHETDKAYRLDYDATEFWVPKSVILNAEEINALITNGAEVLPEVIVAEWFALKAGLI